VVLVFVRNLGLVTAGLSEAPLALCCRACKVDVVVNPAIVASLVLRQDEGRVTMFQIER